MGRLFTATSWQSEPRQLCGLQQTADAHTASPGEPFYDGRLVLIYCVARRSVWNHSANSAPRCGKSTCKRTSAVDCRNNLSAGIIKERRQLPEVVVDLMAW